MYFFHKTNIDSVINKVCIKYEVSKKELRNYDVQNTRSKLIKNENLLSKKVNNFYKKWKES